MPVRAPATTSAGFRFGGWLLAITLALPSLIGWLHVPMGARASLPVTVETPAAENGGSAMTRLLADLAVLCTPYGLRLGGGAGGPEQPAGGRIGHDNCVLCGIAGAMPAGVLRGAPLPLPPADSATTGDRANAATAPAATIAERPPGRGPPN